ADRSPNSAERSPKFDIKRSRAEPLPVVRPMPAERSPKPAGRSPHSSRTFAERRSFAPQQPIDRQNEFKLRQTLF
ncbi:hypothetical protein OFM39_25675, partial [Escherichia coli]|nr:hypothetical protein [Escherichia coli]